MKPVRLSFYLWFVHPLHYWKNVYSTNQHEWNGIIACSYWGTRAWHPCDFTWKSVSDFLRRWAGVGLLLSNNMLGLNEKTLRSMHCMHFLIPRFSHSIRSGSCPCWVCLTFPVSNYYPPLQSSRRTSYWSVLTRWSSNVKGFEFCNCNWKN